MEFEWSDAVSARNLARYDVRFSEAVHIFLDRQAIEFGDDRRGWLSLIGRCERGLLYVVFMETAEGRIRLLHARLADPAAAEVEPEFDFDTRRIKRIPRPDRHIANAADVSPRKCKVTLPLELDADLVAAFRDRPETVNQLLRAALGREDEPLRQPVQMQAVLPPLAYPRGRRAR